MYAPSSYTQYRGGVLPLPPGIPAAATSRLMLGSRCPCESGGLAGFGLPGWAWWLAGGLALIWAVKR